MLSCDRPVVTNSKKIRIFAKKQLTNTCLASIIINVVNDNISGPVVQLVRTLACHARGRRFEPVPGRHMLL